MSDTDTTVRWATKAAQRGYTVAQNIVLFDQRLPTPARLLYFQLAHYAWRNPDAFPTQEEIASNLGVGDRQLRRYAAALEERWLLERRERGLGRPVEYVLHEPPVDYLERDPRPGRIAKRRPGENAGDRAGSSDISDRARTDIDDRLGRTPVTEPFLTEVKEALEDQEETALVVRPLQLRRAITRDDHQRVADEADASLRRAGGAR